MKKFTVASFKSFVKKNRANLLIKCNSSFSGMSDMVEYNEGATFKAPTPTDRSEKNTLGINGVWLVGGSRDFFKVSDNNGFRTVELYNCCGSSTVAVPLDKLAA